MRDRLRAVNCPSDMIDQIGGRSSGKVGEGYAEGYSIIKKKEALLSAVISDCSNSFRITLRKREHHFFVAIA